MRCERARFLRVGAKRRGSGFAAGLLALVVIVLAAGSQTAFGAGPRGTAVAFFPDGKRLLAGSTAGVLDILSVPDGKSLDRIETGQKSVNGIAISADGARVATANGDGTVTIWSAADFSKQFTLAGHAKFVMAVAFSPDGKRVASGGGDMAVRLWDATTGAPLVESKGHGDRVNALAFSADGKLLASASEDGTVRVWDAQSGAEVALLKPPDSNSGLRRVAFSPDAHRVAAGNFIDTFVWELATKTLAYKTSGALYAISFSPDGRRAALGRDGIVLVDAASGTFQASLQPEPEQIGGNPAAMAVSPDWKWFAVLPDRGMIYIAKIADIDAQQAASDCEYDEPRDPMCQGAPCETTKVGFGEGCLQVTNSAARKVRVVATLRCGENTSFDLAPGQTQKISYLTGCARTRGELISVDVIYAKDGEGPPEGGGRPPDSRP